MIHFKSGLERIDWKQSVKVMTPLFLKYWIGREAPTCSSKTSLTVSGEERRLISLFELHQKSVFDLSGINTSHVINHLSRCILGGSVKFTPCSVPLSLPSKATRDTVKRKFHD